MRKLTADLRITTTNRQLFQPGLDKSLRQKIHLLDYFYEIKKESFTYSGREKENYKNETVQTLRSLVTADKNLVLTEVELF